MMNAYPAHAIQLDLVSELRLRRWAREHYVPAEQRDDTWHLVVLNEMESKDSDCIAQQQSQPASLAFVPLAPESVFIRDDRHEQQSPPNLLAETERFEVYIHS